MESVSQATGVMIGGAFVALMLVVSVASVCWTILSECRKTVLCGVEQCDLTLRMLQQLIVEARQFPGVTELVTYYRIEALVVDLRRDRYAQKARRLGVGRRVPASPAIEIERELTT